MLRLAVALASEVLDAPVPDAVRARSLADSRVVALAAEVRAGLDAVVWPKPDTWAASRFQIRLRERARDRWRYLARIATTPTLSDWRTVRLPRALHRLYYPVRAARLGLKYLGKVVR
jgi:hypothetical protein